MDQAISEHSEHEIPPSRRVKRRNGQYGLALVVALVSTALILEAVATVLNGRANGDMMIAVCPILGSVFLSIPAAKAWWVVIRGLQRGR